MPLKLPLKLKSKEREMSKRLILPSKKLSDKLQLRPRLNNKLSSLRQLQLLKKRPKRKSLKLKERRSSDS